MTTPSLALVEAQLQAGEIVRLTEAAWQARANDFTVAQEHATGLAGPLLVVRRDGRWAAVERPQPGERVIRPLRDREDAAAFVRDRLAAYERMWDG